MFFSSLPFQLVSALEMKVWLQAFFSNHSFYTRLFIRFHFDSASLNLNQIVLIDCRFMPLHVSVWMRTCATFVCVCVYWLYNCVCVTFHHDFHSIITNLFMVWPSFRSIYYCKCNFILLLWFAVDIAITPFDRLWLCVCHTQIKMNAPVKWRIREKKETNRI